MVPLPGPGRIFLHPQNLQQGRFALPQRNHRPCLCFPNRPTPSFDKLRMNGVLRTASRQVSLRWRGAPSATPRRPPPARGQVSGLGVRPPTPPPIPRCLPASGRRRSSPRWRPPARSTRRPRRRGSRTRLRTANALPHPGFAECGSLASVNGGRAVWG